MRQSKSEFLGNFKNEQEKHFRDTLLSVEYLSETHEQTTHRNQ